MSSLFIHFFYLLRSKRSERLKGIPIDAKLLLEDCKASVRKIKTETSIGKRAYQGPTHPRKRQRATKSAGKKTKPAPIQQRSGKLGNV